MKGGGSTDRAGRKTSRPFILVDLLMCIQCVLFIDGTVVVTGLHVLEGLREHALVGRVAGMLCCDVCGARKVALPSTLSRRRTTLRSATVFTYDYPELLD